MDGEPESALERLRRLQRERERPKAEEPARPGGSGARRAARAGGLIALLLLLLKGKWVLLLLGKLKFLLVGVKALGLGSLLTTLGSMGAMIWVYAHFYGALFATGFVLLILVHELGHGAMARRMGLRVGAPVFIPFIGAFIAIKGQLRSSWVDCLVGFGGPFAGMLGGIAAAGAGLSVHDPYWRDLLLFLAWLTFYINLFNLIPMMGLDGDRISNPLRARHWLVGVPLLALLLVATGAGRERANVMLLLVLLVGAGKAFVRWRKERSGEPERRLVDRIASPLAGYAAEGEVAPWQRRVAACGYFGLSGALTVLSAAVHGMLPPVSGTGS